MTDDPSESLPNASVKRVRNAYETWASIYDAQDNATRDLAATVVREETPNLDGARVLEFGCGTGLTTAHLAEHATSVAAFDLSSSMLENARDRVPDDHVRFFEHDLTQPWPIARLADGNGAFDTVVGTLVLEHIDDLSFVSQQIANALRPGGHFILCEYHPFRQMMGKQAEFQHPTEEETVQIDSFQHTVSDYVNPALSAGLRLQHMREDYDPDAAPSDPPRLFTVRFEATTSEDT